VIDCVVAERERSIVGFALFFTSFSTFLGQPGLWLEDLYVQAAHRSQGIGRELLVHLARLAVERGYARFEWSVLDWNAKAISFYEKMGATVMPEWRICRVTGDELAALGAR
jgi:GNAT superfamily N-acetyltransferase